METPIKMDDLGVPLFGNSHICINRYFVKSFPPQGLRWELQGFQNFESNGGVHRNLVSTVEGSEIQIMTIMIIWVVVSNIFYVHPYLGKVPILTNIFQMG